LARTISDSPRFADIASERLADLVAVADDDTLVDAGLALAECARQLRALAGKPDPVAALSLPG
jgi:hypothetical protein